MTVASALRGMLVGLALGSSGCGPSDPAGDRCLDFASAYCEASAPCNPDGWRESCLSRVADHCAAVADDADARVADPDACLGLMESASCADWSPELWACWAAYFPQ